MAFDRAIAIITIAAEASNQSPMARLGVAEVIIARARSGKFPGTIAGVCLQRMQFSEWNADPGNNANLLRVAALPEDDQEIVAAGNAYDAALQGSNVARGATHFYAADIAAPAWTIGAVFTAQLGNLRFFKGVK